MKNYGHIYTRGEFMDATACDKFNSLFITLVIVFAVISGTRAAPHIIPANHENHKPVVSTIRFNPCGVRHLDKDIRSKGNHSVMSVRKALDITISNYVNVDKRLIRHTYALTKNLKSQFNITYLVNKKYNENFHNLTEYKVLSELRNDLLTFGEAFINLTNMEPITYSSMKIKRNRTEILTKLQGQLKSLICEVETSINATESEVYIETKASNGNEEWPKNPDLTNMLLIDLSTYTQYIKFLRSRHRLIKHISLKQSKKVWHRQDKHKKPTRKRSANKPRRQIRHKSHNHRS